MVVSFDDYGDETVKVQYADGGFKRFSLEDFYHCQVCCSYFLSFSLSLFVVGSNPGDCCSFPRFARAASGFVRQVFVGILSLCVCVCLCVWFGAAVGAKQIVSRTA